MTSDAAGTAARGGDETLAIFAAGGAIPLQVARAAVAAGRSVFVIGLEGTADERLRAFPHEMVKWGQLGRIVHLLESQRFRELVLIGTVHKRPDFRHMGVDLGAVRLLPEILSLLVGGDDSVLSRLTSLIESRGVRVIGAHEVAPDLVAAPGRVAGPRPSTAARADAAQAMAAARLIGSLDSGQAAVAVLSRVVALEGAEGTDAMVGRVAELRRVGRVKWSGRAGVLAKCAKPQQDLRVDMPAIGPVTVEAVAAAGLAGIAIEARRVMIAEREATVAAARRTGTFIVAADDRAGAGAGA